jgi:arylformamidase
MKVYDLSIALRPGMVVWPDDPEPALQSHLSTRQGDPCNVAQLTLGTHNGAHVDAPFHYFSNGKTVEQVPLDRLVGPARVVEVAGEQDIGAAALETLAASARCLPARSGFSSRRAIRYAACLKNPSFTPIMSR